MCLGASIQSSRDEDDLSQRSRPRSQWLPLYTTPRKTSHPCFALPEEASLRQADSDLQEALKYTPSGGVCRLLSTNQAWSPMSKQDRRFARGKALTRSVGGLQPITTLFQIARVSPRRMPVSRCACVSKNSCTQGCPWLSLNEV
jgi:hypothetical protein